MKLDEKLEFEKLEAMLKNDKPPTQPFPLSFLSKQNKRRK